MLCCVAICSSMLCYDVAYGTGLCCAVVFVVLCCVMLHVTLCRVVFSFVVLCFRFWCSIVLSFVLLCFFCLFALLCCVVICSTTL